MNNENEKIDNIEELSDEELDSVSGGEKKQVRLWGVDAQGKKVDVVIKVEKI